MAQNKTAIARLALSNIHANSSVEDIDIEQSVEAKQSKLWYDVARKQILADFPWGFARKRLVLATHADAAPENEWVYRYQYPADCITARYIENPAGVDADDIPFEVEGADNDTDSIVTDLDEAILVYTRDVIDAGRFPAHFDIAFSYLLGHYLAGVISGKAKFKDRMIMAYRNALLVGAGHDANQGRPRQPRDAEAIRVR